jgi:predicted GNAT family N-acyltransferase
MPVIIKKITPKQTHNVRHKVLRIGKPISSCVFESDELYSTLHFGLFFNNEIVGVVSAFSKNNPKIETDNQYQIRGMAVLELFQGKGFGKNLLHFAEKEISKEKANTIWLNSRENALNFYTRMGYLTVSEPFEINGIGIHYEMMKRIN